LTVNVIIVYQYKYLTFCSLYGVTLVREKCATFLDHPVVWI